MGNMINSQPRFGLEEENGVEKIFDYATGLYTPVGADIELVSVDGIWDTAEIARLVKTSQPLYEALKESDELSVDEARAVHAEAAEERREQAREAQTDKVEQFEEDFLADGTGDSTGVRGEDGLTETERKQKQIDETDEKLRGEAAERDRLAREEAERAQRDEAERNAEEQRKAEEARLETERKQAEKAAAEQQQ